MSKKPSIYGGNLTEMSIKALEKKQNTIAFKVLLFIFSHPEGVRYTDIVKFIIELKGEVYSPELHRGWWSANLNGSGSPWGNKKPGLLPLYCEKTPKGLYKLNQATYDFIEKSFIPEEYADAPLAIQIRFVRMYLQELGLI